MNMKKEVLKVVDTVYKEMHEMQMRGIKRIGWNAIVFRIGTGAWPAMC